MVAFASVMAAGFCTEMVMELVARAPALSDAMAVKV